MRVLRPHVPLLGLGLAIGCATAPIPPAPPMPEAASGWVEMRGPHFTLRTDLHHDEAFAALYRLENTWAAVGMAQWGPNPADSAPLEVIEVRLPHEMAEFGVEAFGTALASTRLGPLLIIGGLVDGQRDFVAPGAVGEYLLREHHHHQPAWLAEGFRGLFGTLRYAEDGDWLQLGGAIALGVRTSSGDVFRGASDVSWLRLHGRLAAGELFAFDPARLGAEENALRFESTSWLLVTFLRQSRAEAFRAYQARLDRGETYEGAWSACFPDLTPANLDHALQVFLDEGLFAAQRLPLNRASLQAHPIAGFTQRPLSADEVHAVRAQLFLSARGPQPAAERVRRAQVELAATPAGTPLSPSALEATLAWSPPALLHPAAAEAARRTPDDPRAWRMLAATAVAPEDVATRQDALAHLLQLRPGAVDAWSAQAELELLAHRGADAASAAGRAWGLQASPAMLRLLALGSAAAGQCQPAREQIQLAKRLLNPSDAKALRWSIDADLESVDAACRAPSPAGPPAAAPPPPPATAPPPPT